MLTNSFVCASLAISIGSVALAQVQQPVVVPDQALINDAVAFEGVVSVRVNMSDCLVSIQLRRSQAIGLAAAVQSESLRTGVMERAKKLVDEIHAICELSEQQKNKLLGAAKVDANRAVRALQRWRTEQNPGAAEDQRAVRRVAGNISTLQRSLRACIYQPSSLVSKSFASITTEEQQETLRDEYLNWFVRRVRDFDAPNEAKLLLLMKKCHHRSLLGAARETYIQNVIDKIDEEQLNEAFDARDCDSIRRAVGMLVKP